MQVFGWRPQQSCYEGSAAAPTCPSVTWFYLLLGGAVVWGMSKRKKTA